MKKMLSGLFALLSILFAAAALAVFCLFRGQIPILAAVPEEAVVRVEQVMDAVCSGDFTRAETMLYGSATLGATGLPEDAAGEQIWKAYVESLDYQLVGKPYATETGVAQDIKFISLEISSVTDNLKIRTQEQLNTAVAAAADVSELYDENNEFREELVLDVLRRATAQALEEDVRYTYQIIPVQLIYSEKQWMVVADQNFLKTISGGVHG